MQNSQAKTKKIFTKFFWGAGKVTSMYTCSWIFLWQVFLLLVLALYCDPIGE